MSERSDGSRVEYDSWSDIYDVWVETAPVTGLNRPFYVQEYVNEPGSVVELGVGNGRILIEAARNGKAMIGVDSSASMLALCRERAEASGVAPLVHLIQADFRDFELPTPASLIAIPFHTIEDRASSPYRRSRLGRSALFALGL
ncbi:MAG: class I SAM-dependent methyltransferase [Chloroflexi bacterium]|nr:class I SAM-dependent methyltransferase [Chloroflexota bacterium]